MEERPPIPPDPASPSDFPTTPAMPSEQPPWAGPPGGEPPGPPPGAPGPEPIPWEQPGLGFFARFYDTLRMLALAPRAAYERVGTTTAVGRPLAFAIIVGWPGILAATLWEIALRDFMDKHIWGGMLSDKAMRDRAFESNPMLEIGIALLSPVWLPVVLFIAAALQHVFLWMVGGARRGFVQTFRVICYAQLATLAGVVPLCGSLAAAVWHVVLQIIGLAAVHRISTARAVFAIVLPLLLCCLCIALVFSMFGAAILSGMKGSGP